MARDRRQKLAAVTLDNDPQRHPTGLPRPELHFLRTPDGLVALDECDLLTILIGNLAETGAGADHVWIGEITCALVSSPGLPDRRQLTMSTRAVRLPLVDGCLPEHLSKLAGPAFVGARPILDSFGPHLPWHPTPDEQRVIDQTVDRQFRNLAWFLVVAGQELFSGDVTDPPDHS